MMSLLPVLLVLMLTGASTADGPAHKFHVTYGRMAIESRVAACEIRFFKHDLEQAITLHSGAPAFRLSPEASPDSLFLDYLNSKLVVSLNGHRVAAALTGSGEETVAQQEMWWYLVQYEADGEVNRLEVKNRLLFELFEDQRNILKVQHFPSEKRLTFYFVSDSDHHEADFPS